MNTCDINSIIIDNLTFARKLARKSQKKYNFVSFDELQSAAYMGLVQAANSYNPEKNMSFQFFAMKRIFGSIKDYIKELCFFKNSKRVDLKDDIVTESKEESSDFFNIIGNCLNKSEKQVVYRYYFIGDNTREIALFLNLHQSRISQILSCAENKMKIFWSDKKEELYEFAV